MDKRAFGGQDNLFPDELQPSRRVTAHGDLGTDGEPEYYNMYE